MAIVSVNKARQKDVRDLDKEKIIHAVEKSYIEAGLDKYITPGQKVLIKPNLVAVPPKRISGAVTLVEVSEALALQVVKAGATPIIGDSSAVGVNTEDVISTCGYDELRQKGYDVRDLKKDKISKLNGFKIYNTVKEVDVIITLPVMKTHDQFEVSLGIKNLKGLLADEEKKRFHNKYNLSEALSEFVSTLIGEKQVLSVMDGIYALEGRGPVFGSPVNMDLILAGMDLVAVDAIASEIMGVNEDELFIEKSLSNKKFGTIDREKIKILGDYTKDNLPVKNFDRGKDIKIEADGFSMVFSKSTCTGCKNTVISCLYDIKEDNLEKKLANKTIITGELNEMEEYNEMTKNGDAKSVGSYDKNDAEVILVGRCALRPCTFKIEILNKTNKQNVKLTRVFGCPPENNEVLKVLKCLQ
ncbi:DUF362 domain-containing protein [Natranaerofaba carboxydovora]|uniref:DUF362 domain-containing protein n=1 Tax=Natranaerofaba carboxydovora TaxID=2742683 RepID=UPI001F12FC67|nr:DUF362 domain-containing protein [Natranaerofaba carboxydovora]UMZ74816.1 hypothetical protein ACONDI_02419 [Natranaerofaba carboxydovora]